MKKNDNVLNNNMRCFEMKKDKFFTVILILVKQ